MMLHHHLEIPHTVSLGVIVAFLAIGILASLWVSRREAVTRQQCRGVLPDFRLVTSH
jgi:hypothetical protein